MEAVFGVMKFQGYVPPSMKWRHVFMGCVANYGWKAARHFRTADRMCDDMLAPNVNDADHAGRGR